MNKLSEAFKNLISKWKSLTKSRKIAFGAIFAGVVAALLYLSISLGSTKYEVLFANMDPKDAAAVYTDLTGKKVNVKIQGNTILVPKDQVDQLRMQTLAEVPMTNGTQGFELLDKSQFGETDAQFKVDYQRALQGELERTIEIFPEVEGARVSLVIPDDSDFVQDTSPGKAFVTLKLKSNQKLTVDQVKSIVALVSGSVKNLPKENVEITDTVSLLTQGLYDNNGTSLDSSTSTEQQQQLKLNYEKQLQDRILNMLQAVYGQDKVKVLVNADLDFDAQQTDTTTYDPKTVTVSEQDTKDTADGSNSQTSASPVDNNMVNNTTTTTTTNPNGNVTTHESSTKNYDVSKTDSKTIKAPGAVRRLTTSVVIDGNLDNATKASVQNLVASAVGFDGTRGDTIDVESMAFDPTIKNQAQQDLNSINQSIAQEKRTKIYTMVGIAVGALLVLGAVVFALRRRSENEEILPKGIDITIGNESDLTQPLAQAEALEDASSIQKKLKFKPIDLDVENEKTHIENEIRKYASNKPDQVADIIKSWISEDER